MRVLLVANAAFNLLNYRARLIAHLVSEGFIVNVAVPYCSEQHRRGLNDLGVALILTSQSESQSGKGLLGQLAQFFLLASCLKQANKRFSPDASSGRTGDHPRALFT